jgi:hypothetical protein
MAASQRRLMIVGSMGPSACAQHLLQCDGAPMFLQQIAERFIRQVLEGDHAIVRQTVERIQSFEFEGDALANAIGVACYLATLLLLLLGLVGTPLRDWGGPRSCSK